MENWQTVITFTQPHEAHMAKSVLESEGIETLIQDEFVAQVHNFYSNAIGGVKLKIKDHDLEKGISVLQRGGYIKPENEEKRNIEYVPLSSTINKSICPFCQSDNIGRKNVVNILTVILYFLLGALFPIFKRSHVCYDCNKLWKLVKIKKK